MSLCQAYLSFRQFELTLRAGRAGRPEAGLFRNGASVRNGHFEGRGYTPAPMAKTREIKKRIKAVGNIRRITKTMQMIATSKFANAQQRAVATKPYTEGVFGLVTELAATAGNVSHPLINGPEGKVKAGAKEVTLIITSDRGLCGPYNGSVLRTSMGFLRNNSGASSGEIELIGKKGVSFLRFNNVTVSQTYSIGD